MLSSVGAVTREDVRTDGFMIQAAYGPTCKVNIREIPAQSSSYIGGMPFNIEEALVQYGMSDYGRRIANFDIISNVPFTINITANKMIHDGENQPAEDLHYILTFQYLLGYYENGVINEGNDTIHSVISRTGLGTNWNLEATSDPDTFLGTVDGTIYFMFDEESSSFIAGSNDATLPVGNYTAEVIIEVISEGA